MTAILHITNGDCTADRLRQSGVPGPPDDVGVWAEALFEGPAPAGVEGDDWRRMRARFYADAGYALSYEEALATLREWDNTLDACRDYGETVFWFEHDLFDQFILIRHIDWLSRQDSGPTRLSLICIGDHPAVDPFRGLGQLRPAQLAPLMDQRRPITPEQIDLGRRAWAAFRADDPVALQTLVEGDTLALPFLADALRRHLAEYPAVRTGLSRTEAIILQQLAQGPRTRVELFRGADRHEPAVFMGDTSFFRTLDGLAKEPSPLVEMAGASYALTDAGRAVLAGDADAVVRRGLDRWLGGVHLQGHDVPWRWDPQAQRLTLG